MKKYNYMQLKNEQYFLPEWSFKSHYESISSADLTNGLHYPRLHLNLQPREGASLHFYVGYVCGYARAHMSICTFTVVFYEWPDVHATFHGNALGTELVLFTSTLWLWMVHFQSLVPTTTLACLCSYKVVTLLVSAKYTEEAIIVTELFGFWPLHLPQSLQLQLPQWIRVCLCYWDASVASQWVVSFIQRISELGGSPIVHYQDPLI